MKGKISIYKGIINCPTYPGKCLLNYTFTAHIFQKFIVIIFCWDGNVQIKTEVNFRDRYKTFYINYFPKWTHKKNILFNVPSK